MKKIVFSCEIRLFPESFVLRGHDLLDWEYGGGTWVSFRMVKISKEAFNSVFLNLFVSMLNSTKFIHPDEPDEKELSRRWINFCGFSSERRLDESCKMLHVMGWDDGFIKLVPTRYQRNRGFAHMTDCADILPLELNDLTERILQGLSKSVGA